MKPVIREMVAADLDRIDELEEQIFPDPWPTVAFEEHLKDPEAGGAVSLSGDVIIGYSCYWGDSGQMHLTNMAVDPVYRRKSVANDLLAHILDLARKQGCELIFLEVRVSNEIAHQFYKSAGFQTIDRSAGYYNDPTEDALVMSRWIEPDRDGK